MTRKLTPPVIFRPRADWEDQEPVLPELQVFEPEDEPVDTGLLDARGVKLYRQPAPKSRMGFL